MKEQVGGKDWGRTLKASLTSWAAETFLNKEKVPLAEKTGCEKMTDLGGTSHHEMKIGGTRKTGFFEGQNELV